MDIVIQSLRQDWEILLRAAPRVLFALVVFAAVVIAGRLAGRGLSLVLERARSPKTHRDFFRKMVIWIFVFFGLSIALNIVGLGGVATGLLTGGGVTAVVLGFAFREIGENFLAGFFLAFSRPFRQGDLIQSGDLEGVVTRTEIRSTTIRTADGRDIFIPSSQLFKNPLINFTLDGLRRLEFRVGIDFRDDPDEACRIMLKVVAENAEILTEPKPFAGLQEMAPAYLELSVTFWIDAFKMKSDIRKVRSDVLNASRKALLAAGFTLSSEVSTVVDVRAPGTIPVSVNHA